MDEKTLKQILESSGVPFAYHRWKDEQAMPYGVYYFDRCNGFAADGVVYSYTSRYQVELYTADKQPAVEKALESALTAAGIYWNKTTETYIDKQCMQFTTYEIEV